jgi:hypothetical protein
MVPAAAQRRIVMMGTVPQAVTELQGAAHPTPAASGAPSPA